MMTSSDNHGRRNGAGRAPSLFDTWLQDRLQRLYDDTLDEAVPDNLLELLSEPTERREH